MYIYKTTNIINGKIYIGFHKSKRKNYLGSGKILKEAIKKYGRENFKNEILEYCDNEIILSEREIYWIKYYDSTNRLIGYNIQDGGSGNIGICKGYWLNKKLSDEHKKNISKNHADVSGENNPMFGKTHSESVRENLREIKTNFKYSEETRQKQSEKRKGEKNPNSKLNKEMVINIRNKYKNDIDMKTLSEKYNVNKPCVWKIVNNYTWKHLK